MSSWWRPKPKPPATRTIAFGVAHEGVPVVNAEVIMDGTPTDWVGRTNGLGYVKFDGVVDPFPQSHVWVNAAGFSEYNAHLEIPSGNWTFLVGSYHPVGERETQLPPLEPLAPLVPPLSRLRREGRRLVNEGGVPFIWKGVSGFRLLELIAAGAESQAVAYLDWCAANRVNLVRVFTMCKNMFVLQPEVAELHVQEAADLAAARGLYLELVALADTFAYPEMRKVEHVRILGDIAARTPSLLIEMCNEPMQQWQRHSRDELISLAAHIPSHVPVCLGAADGAQDESHEYCWTGASYQTVHSSRLRAPWGNVRHTKEEMHISESEHVYVINDEPARDLNAAQQLALGGLERVCMLGGTWHDETGKQCIVPTGASQALFEALRAGWESVPETEWGAFTNYGWRPPLPESPVDHYEGLSDDARAYSLLVGNTAYTDLIHGRNIAFKAPWQVVGSTSLDNEAHVYQLSR